MESFLEYYLNESYKIDETNFEKEDFSHYGQYDYLSTVLTTILNGGVLSLGSNGTDGEVNFADKENLSVVKELSVNVDFEKKPQIELSTFNEITLKAKPKFTWRKIWKYPFSKATNRLEHEHSIIGTLNAQIDALKGEDSAVKISCNSGICEIVSAEKVPGTPKADIVLKGKTDKDSIWISLKKGTKIKEFGGYGGISMSHLIRAKKNGAIKPSDIKVAKAFAEHFGKIRKDDFKGRYSDNEAYPVPFALQRVALYGIDSARSKPFGKDKCNYVIQSDPEKLRLEESKEKGIYFLTGAHVLTYPKVPSKNSEYYPIFCARNSRDRNNYGLKGIRVGIFPKGYLSKTSDDV